MATVAGREGCSVHFFSPSFFRTLGTLGSLSDQYEGEGSRECRCHAEGRDLLEEERGVEVYRRFIAHDESSPLNDWTIRWSSPLSGIVVKVLVASLDDYCKVASRAA